jgi:NAD(P)-dependent dehydrogenase (short-subunit alcohol dehydrogenase family)
MQKALVVGGTSGIGKGIALALAQRGDVAVCIAGRNQERGLQVVQELTAICPRQEHSFRAVDCFDLESVKKLADVDCNLLVMTQGMATTQGYTPTKNGMDQKLQLHYFSRLYLAKRMAPRMAGKANARVLTVLSAGVHGRYAGYETDFELKQSYSTLNAANAAGFYTDAGFESLANAYPTIVFAHAAPGFVNSNWGSELPAVLWGVVRAVQPLGRSIVKCGQLLSAGWLKLPNEGFNGKYYLLDRNGNVIENGIKHTNEERDVIYSKTLAMFPDY